MIRGGGQAGDTWSSGVEGEGVEGAGIEEAG